MRIGHGYDIHRFTQENTQTPLMLGGVEIPFDKALVAHSDGDVVIHALCDALLGACSLGDIGQHFPDTSQNYKNADSRVFLKEIIQKVKSQGYQLGNADISIIAQAPRLSSYLMAMREALSLDCEVLINDINIKATTNEQLDAIGEKRAIAAHAVVLVTKNT